MANIIHNISDALDSTKYGSRQVMVWIAEKLDDKSFLIADETSKCSLLVVNEKILEKKYCNGGNFVKVIHPSVSDEGDGLVLTEKSVMVPLRAKGEAMFRGSPAPFVPCYDPVEAMGNQEDPHGFSSSAVQKQDYGSFDVECNRKIGDVSNYFVFDKYCQISLHLFYISKILFYSV